jgi:hypothetical protein
MKFLKMFFIYSIFLSICISVSYQIKKNNAYAKNASCDKCSEIKDQAQEIKIKHEKLVEVLKKNEALLKTTPDSKSTLKIKINSNLVLGNIRRETLSTQMKVFRKLWRESQCRKNCKHILKNANEDI